MVDVAAAAPGPARSTTSSRPTLDDAVAGRLAGAGALRRPAGRRLRPRARATSATTTARWPTSNGPSAPSRCSPPETAALFRAVADRWAGTSSTSSASASRPGTPRAESSAPARAARARCRAPGAERLRPLPRRARPSSPRSPSGRAARAVWSALPGEDWPARLAEAVRAAYDAGRGAVVVVPDARDLRPARRRADRAPWAPGRHVALSRRPRARPSATAAGWPCAAARCGWPSAPGPPRTPRSPTSGLLAIWDDGDDLHAEPRAPYPHARDVLVLRSALTGAALLLGGHARTAEAPQLVETGLGARDRGRRAPCCGPARRGSSRVGRRRRARPRPRRGGRPAAQPGLAHDPRGARRRAARCWCRCRARGYVPVAGLRPRPHPGPLRDLLRPAGRRLRAGRRRRAAGAAARPADWPCPVCGGTPAARRRRRLRAHRRGARPRVPGCTRCAPPAATTCWPRSRPSRRSWSPRRAPSRSAPAATARRCCSTAGRCCRAPTCARPRRRCAAGRTPRRSCAPAARWSSGADAGVAGRPGAGALGPGRVRGPRARRARRAGLPAGHPDGVAHRRRRPRVAELLDAAAAAGAAAAGRAGAGRCRTPTARAGAGAGTARQGRELARALKAAAAVRSARRSDRPRPHRTRPAPSSAEPDRVRSPRRRRSAARPADSASS